jgi:hypothetical protein
MKRRQAKPQTTSTSKAAAPPRELNSDNTKDALSSNPTHPLEKHSEETTSKKV